MANPKKFIKTIPVSVQRTAYDKVIKHIETHYGNIGKFFSMAAVEKMERDEKKMAMIDTGND